jgi:hypothetical protein
MSAEGIKELSEVLEAVKIVAVAGAKISKDGKVGADDLTHLIELGAQVGKIADAVQGLELIEEEVKGLTLEEAKLVVEKVYDLVASIKAAKA